MLPYCTYSCFMFFFFNDTATTEIYTLSLHDALPICFDDSNELIFLLDLLLHVPCLLMLPFLVVEWVLLLGLDRKSTRLNSSHANISYAVFCLKKKKKQNNTTSYAEMIQTNRASISEG